MTLINRIGKNYTRHGYIDFYFSCCYCSCFLLVILISSCKVLCENTKDFFQMVFHRLTVLDNYSNVLGSDWLDLLLYSQFWVYHYSSFLLLFPKQLQLHCLKACSTYITILIHGKSISLFLPWYMWPSANSCCWSVWSSQDRRLGI